MEQIFAVHLTLFNHWNNHIINAYDYHNISQIPVSKATRYL